ncbi:hypothetical protein AB0M57_08625 [Streptomyces sp. NPDC051597]|uniref:hypothetical protein n=1 Tax=Streptomyces sp. NPDC051597 TaxID=3155049 RepID=UPI003424E0BB
MATVVILASLAALFEIVGIAVTIVDIRAARKRVAGYLKRPRHVYASADLAVAFAAAVDLEPGNQTLEKRIGALEAWRRGLPDELKYREDQLKDQLASDFRNALTAAEKTIDDQFQGLREYVEGAQQSFWAGYRGPIILVAGVVLGLVVNIVSSLRP